MSEFSPTPVVLDDLNGLRFEIDGIPVAVVVDAAGNAVRSYVYDGDGTAVTAGTLGAAEGLGMILPENLGVVAIDGQVFGLVSSAGTSSISVFQISPAGGLEASDQVIDGQGTRFASVSTLEVVEADGRAFVMAAGADNGLTLLELLPDGRLLHHATFTGSAEAPLRDISGVTGSMQDGALRIAVETGSGTTDLSFDFSGAGDVLSGGAGDDVLTGTARDDILVSGEGQDSLTGGAGADSFVFGGDGDGGTVMDFNAAQDRLDLSGWFGLREVAQLDFIRNGDRLDIGFEGRSATLYSHDGKGLKAEHVIDNITINPSHSMIGDAPVAANAVTQRVGGTGDDVLFGASGRDVFRSDGGADHFVGGDGFDVVDYGAAGAGIRLDLHHAHRSAGDAANDRFHSIEGVTGTGFGDVMKGGMAADWLDGGASNDKLVGRAGDDSLHGGEGDDKLVGGGGNDSLEGGDGADKLVGGRGDDILNGGEGNDEIVGGDGNDSIEGGAGIDKLFGNGGDDTLDGDEGDDQLVGGAGNDSLNGGDGADKLVGGSGDDILQGGEGDDEIVGGGGNDGLNGGAGMDHLKGRGGSDLLDGGAGDDQLKGHGGNDTLNGGEGDDRLIGGGGKDKLYGDAGNDRLTGGGGADEFYFVAGDDSITDFDAGTDFLYLSAGLLDDPSMTAAEILSAYGEDLGSSVRFDFGPDGDGLSTTLTIENVGTLDQLADSLFLY